MSERRSEALTDDERFYGGGAGARDRHPSLMEPLRRWHVKRGRQMARLTLARKRPRVCTCNSYVEMGIVIRTRTAGLVAAMMPSRLCCRTAPHGAPAAGTRAMRP